MKKWMLAIVAILSLPALASAEPGVKRSHSLDDVGRTTLKVGLGSAGMDIDFGGGYFLYNNSKSGTLVGFSGETQHGLNEAVQLVRSITAAQGPQPRAVA